MNNCPETGTGLSSATPSATSTSFLERLRGREAGGWERFCKVYGPLVYRWARKAGLQDQDAVDVGQEVFRTVAGRLASFRRDQPADTFRGWLWVITHNKLGDHFRRREAQPEAIGGTEAFQRLQHLPEMPRRAAETSDGSAQDPSLVHHVAAVIRGEFEEVTWQAFYRAVVEEHAVADIARDLGMTRHAVHQAKYRVLRRLRQELDEGC